MLEILNGWLLILVYFLGFLAAVVNHKHDWLVARITAGFGLFLTAISIISAIIYAHGHEVSLDKLGLTMAMLVSLLGWVIINYSFRYLQGELNQHRFVCAILFTLFSVSLVVLSQHLALMVLAWSGTSIGLHYLLTFYPERKAAQIVAHKKFIVSRLADVCLLVALLCVYQATGTLMLPEIKRQLATMAALSPSLYVAIMLFTLAAILKSAQLPLHGWLIQVMEAPTPVSALLHAGVVNLGGFILIRLAELLSLAPLAQIMLIVVGSITAVLASLVMMTRISIKVRLAWSTCAQMGFMLMEIGLGLYELALMHLVAHSLYKAYAFLSTGDIVIEAKHSDFLNTRTKSIFWYVSSLLLTAIVVSSSFTLWQLGFVSLNVKVMSVVIVSLGLAPLMWLEQGHTKQQLVFGLMQVFILTQLYLIGHWLFTDLAPAATVTAWPMLLWVVMSFLVLYSVQICLRVYPNGYFAKSLYPWAYSGFYLDEIFTRLTFQLWPIKLKSSATLV